MKLIIVFIAFAMLGVPESRAEELKKDHDISPIVISGLLNMRLDQGIRRMSPTPIQSRTEWDFIGCMPTHHACEDEAEARGFPHHRMRIDSRVCPAHPHIACYVGHH